MNGIQQLRKGAGLDLKDVVEVFYEEAEGVTVVESAVAENFLFFEAKFKGVVPLPRRHASTWAVVLGSDMVDVGGSSVKVSICRPSIAVDRPLSQKALNVLATLEPSDISPGEELIVEVDGDKMMLKEGKDFWLSASSMIRS
jgi:hypothetical protein